MKPAVLVPIIIGSVILVTGGVLFAIGIKNNRSSKPVTNTYEIKEDFNKFDFQLETANLEFKSSTDGATKVECYETEKDFHQVSVVDNALTIRYQDTRKWHEKIFFFNVRRMKVTVYLPDATYDALKVNISTGDVIIPNNFTFSSVDATLSTGNLNIKANVTGNTTVKVTTGNVVLENNNLSSLNLTSSTGDLHLKNNKVAGDIKVESTTGHIYLDNVTAKNFNSHSTTGSVNLKNTVIENEIVIKASTGDVSFDHSDAATLDIETSTGDVTGTLLTNKIFSTQTSTGKVDVPTSTTGGLCKIKTTTGDIKISIAK